MLAASGPASTPSAAVGRATSAKEGGPILLPIVDGAIPDQMLQVGVALAAGTDSRVVLLNVVRLPEQTPLSLSRDRRGVHDELVRRAIESAGEVDRDVPVQGEILVGHRLESIIATAVEKFDPSAVIAARSWFRSRVLPFRRRSLERFVETVDPPVILSTPRPFPETVSTVLAPVAGGPNAETASKTARAIAQSHDAHVELLHVVTPERPESPRRPEHLLSRHRELFDDDDAVDTWLLEAEDETEAIVEQSTYYDLTVVGGPRSSRLRRFVFGSTARFVQDRAENAVVTAWK